MKEDQLGKLKKAELAKGLPQAELPPASPAAPTCAASVQAMSLETSSTVRFSLIFISFSFGFRQYENANFRTR